MNSKKKNKSISLIKISDDYYNNSSDYESIKSTCSDTSSIFSLNTNISSSNTSYSSIQNKNKKIVINIDPKQENSVNIEISDTIKLTVNS